MSLIAPDMTGAHWSRCVTGKLILFSPALTPDTPCHLQFLSLTSVQASLDIDPLALRPGATPPIKSPDEKAVSFDEPVHVKTLYNPTKVGIII